MDTERRVTMRELVRKATNSVLKVIFARSLKKNNFHYSLFKPEGGMFVIFDIWWGKDCRKNFSIINYKEAWKEAGNKPRISFYENGGRRKNGDWCFDVFLTVGYIIINYTNFDLQRR